MPKPSKVIEDIFKQKELRIIDAQEKKRRLIEELRDQVISEIAVQGSSKWDIFMQKQLFESLNGLFITYNLKMQSELDRVRRDIWQLGINLVDMPLVAGEIGYSPGMFAISDSSLNALADFQIMKLKEVSAKSLGSINSEITLGIMGGKSPGQVIESIGDSLRATGSGKSIWSSLERRAEVIVQTEMGRIFSIANQERMEQASEVVPELQKEWRHANKRRFGTKPKVPRRNHLAAHGDRVPVDEAFNVKDKKGRKLRFPRDPAVGIDAVINCNCDHVPWMDEWQD